MIPRAAGIQAHIPSRGRAQTALRTARNAGGRVKRSGRIVHSASLDRDRAHGRRFGRRERVPQRFRGLPRLRGEIRWRHRRHGSESPGADRAEHVHAPRPLGRGERADDDGPGNLKPGMGIAAARAAPRHQVDARGKRQVIGSLNATASANSSRLCMRPTISEAGSSASGHTCSTGAGQRITRRAVAKRRRRPSGRLDLLARGGYYPPMALQNLICHPCSRPHAKVL